MKTYCKITVNNLLQRKKNRTLFSIRDNRGGHMMQLAKAMHVAQMNYNYMGAVALTKDNSRGLAQARRSKGEFNLTGMQHNYAYEVENPGNWARSALNRHSEHLIAMRKLQGINMTLLTERKPCDLCKADLKAFADLPGNNLDVQSFISAQGGGAVELDNLYRGAWGSVSASTDLS